MHSLKKKLLYYILFNCCIASIYAQIPNGGFENWSSCVHPITYPVSPSNEKSVLNNYLDSLVSGNFKLYYPAFISPNGDGIQDSLYFTSNEMDSIVSFQFSIGDFCSNRIINTMSYIPTIGENTISIPAWDGTGNSGRADSTGTGGTTVDQGIYQLTFTCTLSNGSILTKHDSIQVILFEKEPIIDANPLDWTTTNFPYRVIPTAQDTVHYPVAVGHYSLRLENNLSFVPSLNAYGICYSMFSINTHPTSLIGYYTFLPQNTDTMSVLVNLIHNGNVVSTGNFYSYVTQENWTSFQVNLSDYAIADSAEIIITAFHYTPKDNGFTIQGNSVLHIDNLNFNALYEAVPEVRSPDAIVTVYPNPFNISTHIHSSEDLTGSVIEIYSSLGAKVASYAVTSGHSFEIPRSNLPVGVYNLRILNGGKVIGSEKIVITE